MDTAILAIEAGGKVSDASGSIATMAGTSGSVTITGIGSEWANTNVLSVGSSGTGALTIESGGTARATYASIGDLAGSNGTALVTSSARPGLPPASSPWPGRAPVC